MATRRLLPVALACLAGCSPSSPRDAGVAIDALDVVVTPPCSASFTLDPGDATGNPAPLGATSTQARAGRITAAQLPHDATGLEVWAPNDFVLANDRVAVIIDDARAADLYDPWGGAIVGMGHMQGGAIVEAADFNEAMFLLGRHTVHTTHVGVLNDGSDGNPAVVRAVGQLAPIPFLDDFARSIAPGDFSDIGVALDYQLAPGSDVVEMYMTLDVTRTRPVQFNQVFHAFFQADRMPRFSPALGFATSMSDPPAPFVAFVDDTATSYAWASPDGPLTPLLSVSGLDIFSASAFSAPACAQTRRHVASVTVGGNGLDGLVQTVARTQSQTLRAVTGTVHDATGAPAAGVHVHATSADGATYYTRAFTDATGAFTLHVPTGQAAKLTAYAAGNAPAGPVTVAADASSATLAMGPVGTIDVTVTDGDAHAPLPVRLQVLPVGAPVASVPASFGEPSPGNGRLYIQFPTDGRVTVPAVVGSYDVIASRGPEYDLQTARIAVTAGATTTVPLALHHVVDTTGVLCGDFHVHTHRSPDASDPVEFKIASMAGEGIEIAVRSDHEFVADFAPMIGSMGLGSWLYALPSIELTTFVWGHFGVIPAVPNASLPNGGAPQWAGLMPPQVFAAVRARPEAPTIIINHPRDPHGAPQQAYFDAVGLDPATATPSHMEMWDTGFTAIEVFTGKDYEQSRDNTVRDWLSLLAHGRRAFAVGSSDSHEVFPDGPIGYPRTCLRVGTDDPHALTANIIRDALAQGHSVISGGLFVTATAPGGAGPGQDAMGVGATASVDVTVQAPAWMQASDLEVVVDGATLQHIAIDATTVDPGNPVMRFHRAVNIPVAAGGSFVVFVAEGGGDLAPVLPGRHPYGVTNPIFLHP